MLTYVLAVLAAQLDVAPEQHLNRARVCMGALDFECAERSLARVRSALKMLPPELAVEALRLSAEAALSVSQLDRAEAHLLELLLRDPTFAPKAEAWPPQWLAVFEAAKARVPDQDPPRVEVDLTTTEVPSGRELVIRASIEDPSGIARATLHLLDPTAEIPMSVTEGTFFAVIPAERVRAPELRFYVTAFDRYGHGPARTGEVVLSVVDPSVAVAVAPPPAPVEDVPVTSTWWFWTIIGVAAAGAAATTAVVLAPDRSGTVTARLEWP